MASIANIDHTLAAAVANAATFVIAYPTGSNQAALLGSTGGVMVVDGMDVHKQGVGFSAVFGLTDITITNSTGYTLAAGAKLSFSFGNTARNGSYNLTLGAEQNQAKRGNA